MSPRRTAHGGAIDRNRTIHFTFDGKAYTGHPGDTLASALMANGVSLLGRSFKYHRPRGLMSAGVEEPNALVTVLRGDMREPNIPATIQEIYDGLRAESQNRFPSLSTDIHAINQLGSELLGAGFYYKTFMGPAFGPLKGTRFWRFCEHFIRKAAGLGRACEAADTSRYDRINAFCDVLVVGSGPSGIAAALTAAESGKSVILAELDAEFGGAANWSGDMINDQPGEQWAAQNIAGLSRLDNVRLLRRTNVWGYYDGGALAALERVSDHVSVAETGAPRHRHWTIRANAVVLATGALERPLVFPGNDRPGVMLAGAGTRLVNSFGVLAGERVALFTNNDAAYASALQVRRAGASIIAIIDVREQVSEHAREIVAACGAELLLGQAVVATQGRKALTGAVVQSFDADTSLVRGEKRSLAIDCLMVSGGWSPTIHLASQAGQRPVWDDDLQGFLPPTATENWIACGAANGVFDTDMAISEGEYAGATAVGARVNAPPSRLSAIHRPAPIFEIRTSDGKGQKAFIDFQHDVTADDIRLAHQEGYSQVEHLKRYTTLGMATDQGKSSNVPALAILAELLGMRIPEVGSTRFRPPFAPVSVGSLAAERFRDFAPDRLTPLHDWHLAHGATMYAAGLWHRPMIYAQAGENVEQAYVREARAVRECVGIVDVSTLGKIAVQGPDAAEFLDRIYTNVFSTLPVGKARYGLMLREDGLPYDDGTTWRLGEHDFLMTTTTANGGKVLEQLEYYLDVVWPELRVALTSVTDQWAGAAIAGPNARRLLEGCVVGSRVDNGTLPFMGIVHAEISGAPVMICRLSFSGELAYEVYSGAGHGVLVWEALMAAGKVYGVVPYGLEALGVLRIEKGHVTGAEIDGRVTARDLHLDWMLSKKKPFVGSAMMDRPGLIGADRLQLVGLVSLDNRPLNGGAHVAENLDSDNARISIGHLTAACYSPALGKYIALALISGGSGRLGDRVFVSDPLRGRFGPVEIVSHHFFDPEGVRMHG